MPHRVQLSRKKGWRMPPNTVSVARPTKWGNPYKIGGRDHNNDVIENRCDAKHAFALWIGDLKEGELQGWKYDYLTAARAELRGKNLACWCPLDAPCHADVLLELANAPGTEHPNAFRTHPNARRAKRLENSNTIS